MTTRLGLQLLALALAGAAGAGELVFTNGNRVTGELVNDVVLVSTGADVIEVLPEEIRVLTRDTIELRDGRVLHGTVVGGRLKARTPLGELAIHVDQLEVFRSDEAIAAALRTPSPVSPAPTAARPPVPAPAGPEPGSSLRRAASAPEPTGPATLPERASPLATSPPDPGPAAAPGPASDTRKAPPDPSKPRVARAPGQAASTAPGPQGFVDGAKRIGHGVVEAADLMHDGFKALGVAIWGAVTGSERALRAARPQDLAPDRPREVGPDLR